MATLQVREFENTFVIHFGGEFTRVNAYTLASTLVGIADAAKAANAVLNPGYEVEIVVDAFAPGSFKATVRAIYTTAGNLFSQENLKAIALSVVAAFIYEHTLSPSTATTVTVGTDEVVIVQGDTRIVVPREIHEATQQVERSPNFRKGVADALRTVDADPQVRSIGFAPRPTDSKPPLEIPHERFAYLPQFLSEPDTDERVLDEITDLRIYARFLSGHVVGGSSYGTGFGSRHRFQMSLSSTSSITRSPSRQGTCSVSDCAFGSAETQSSVSS